MKNALAIQDDIDPSVAMEVDPMPITRKPAACWKACRPRTIRPEAETEDVVPEKVSRSASSPFLLESLYFRSFGERGLLEREEELALAKQLDLGTRQIRQRFSKRSKSAGGLKRIRTGHRAYPTLQTVRRLSGLSATVAQSGRTRAGTSATGRHGRRKSSRLATERAGGLPVPIASLAQSRWKPPKTSWCAAIFGWS